jgi:Tol biopolymer transport system component
MLTGKRAFPGEDLTDTLAAVVRADPDWMSLPPGLSSALVIYLRRCLHKDPKQRIPDIAAMRLALEGAFETVVSASATRTLRTSAARHALPWAVAGIFGVGLIAALLLLWAPWRSVPVPAPRTVLASIGADASLPTNLGASMILSPDGTTLAFVGQQAGQSRLFVRTLDHLQAAALAGTEDAASPFFSPDGQWIAFFAGGQLKKIAITGGAVVTLCDAPSGRGGTWADDDTILFTPAVAPNTRLMRVSAAGGTPAVFGTLSQGAIFQRWPQALPGGKAVLYAEHSSLINWDGANLVVAPLSGGTPKIVVRGGYYGRYVASGHLIYMHQGTMFAVPFDRDRLEPIGHAVPVLDRVAASVTGSAQLAVSAEGTLVYVTGTAATDARPVDWLARDGKTAVLRATKGDWANPRFSPDGQKLALEIFDGKQRDVWVYEWARDRLTQLTFDPGQDSNPVWTPDGRRVVFASDRAKRGVANLYWVNADGTGGVTRLTDSPESQQPSSWHPSGKFLAFHANRAATGSDLMILPMEGDDARGWTSGNPTVFLGTPAFERFPMFSPDGRWIAYSSNAEVYVGPFPGPGGPWRISTGGGTSPRWSATANELLFLTLQGNIMAASYAVVGDSFRADTPQIWSPTGVQGGSAVDSPYDLHPDGRRVAVAATPKQAGVVQDKVVFVFNFADYLRKIAPATK